MWVIYLEFSPKGFLEGLVYVPFIAIQKDTTARRIKAEEKAKIKMGHFEQRKHAQAARRVRIPKNEWAERIERWDQLIDKTIFIEEYR